MSIKIENEQLMWYKKIDSLFSRNCDIIKRIRSEQNGRKQTI